MSMQEPTQHCCKVDYNPVDGCYYATDEEGLVTVHATLLDAMVALNSRVVDISNTDIEERLLGNFKE